MPSLNYPLQAMTREYKIGTIKSFFFDKLCYKWNVKLSYPSTDTSCTIYNKTRRIKTALSPSLWRQICFSKATNLSTFNELFFTLFFEGIINLFALNFHTFANKYSHAFFNPLCSIFLWQYRSIAATRAPRPGDAWWRSIAGMRCTSCIHLSEGWASGGTKTS